MNLIIIYNQRNINDYILSEKWLILLERLDDLIYNGHGVVLM
jgi:hypothetical protein